MKDYIPELSEVRMARRAPNRPPPWSAEDAVYVEACLRGAERAFGVEAAPGVIFAAIDGRTLITFFIDNWRGLQPQTPEQRDAHARMPSAIRLIDNYSMLLSRSD